MDRLEADVFTALREGLGQVADDVLAAIVAEVPSYSRAFAGRMGDQIRQAVMLALGGFLEMAARADDPEVPSTPSGPAVEGAYGLGRGEARAGRSMDALLSAYRVGARVAWRRLSDRYVDAGLPSTVVAAFAELTFAYIDQLSAASVAGHADELQTTGRVRERLRERLARLLVSGAPTEALRAAAERADWPVPETVTVVLLPLAQVRGAAATLPAGTLVLTEDVPGAAEGLVTATTQPEEPERAVLVVPDASRPVLLRALVGRRAVVGPGRPWTQAPASLARALRLGALGVQVTRAPVDSEDHLVPLVLSADPEALADLRARALAPLADLKPASAAKLEETLRAWLLCQGRRDDVAGLLFVHAQTVRYRMGQLRELYGEALEDPERVLELVLALGPLPGTQPAQSKA